MWYLIKPGTCVPCGTGPQVGSTKRPFELCTLSLRNIDTWDRDNKDMGKKRKSNQKTNKEIYTVCQIKMLQ